MERAGKTHPTLSVLVVYANDESGVCDAPASVSVVYANEPRGQAGNEGTYANVEEDADDHPRHSLAAHLATPSQMTPKHAAAPLGEYANVAAPPAVSIAPNPPGGPSRVPTSSATTIPASRAPWPRFTDSLWLAVVLSARKPNDSPAPHYTEVNRRPERFCSRCGGDSDAPRPWATSEDGNVLCRICLLQHAKECSPCIFFPRLMDCMYPEGDSRPLRPVALLSPHSYWRHKTDADPFLHAALTYDFAAVFMSYFLENEDFLHAATTLMATRCFFGRLSEEEATLELADMPGYFLLRFSSRPGNYVISVCTNSSRVRHLRLEIQPNRTELRVCAQGTSEAERALSLQRFADLKSAIAASRHILHLHHPHNQSRLLQGFDKMPVNPIDVFLAQHGDLLGERCR